MVRILRHIPIISLIIEHPASAHKVTAIKFFILWLISTSPVIFSVFLSQVPNNRTDVGTFVMDKLSNTFTLQEQFVYSAAFLAPVIYIIVDIIATIQDRGKEQHFLETIRRQTKGYSFVIVSAIFLLISTAIAFGGAYGNNRFDDTVLYHVAGQNSNLIYICSLVLWYTALLRDALSIPDYNETHRSGEDSMKSRFSQRLRERQGRNDE